MKKLMFGLAAMVAGSVMAIESENIVGYQAVPALAGYTFVTPSFAGISSDYSVQSVKISGENVYGEGDETLQIIDNEGNIGQSFTWYAAGMVGTEEGWYDDNDEYSEMTIDPGSAFLVANDNGAYIITFAGQVNYSAIPAFECTTGFTSVGNMTPIAKSVQKFIISGENVYGEGDETIQFLDEEGNVSESFTWYAAGMVGTKEGWYNDSDEFASKEIAPGSAFLLSNDNGAYVVSVPATND